MHLVTPAHVNGHSAWLMEPLKEICIVQDGPTGDPGYLYKVANGASYSMHHRRNLEALIVTDVIFSAEKHLRQSDINA